jgi:hypothetical protein
MNQQHSSVDIDDPARFFEYVCGESSDDTFAAVAEQTWFTRM